MRFETYYVCNVLWKCMNAWIVSNNAPKNYFHETERTQVPRRLCQLKQEFYKNSLPWYWLLAYPTTETLNPFGSPI